MKKLSLILFVGFLLGMSGCIKDSDYILNRKGYPVVLQFSLDLMRFYFLSPIDGVCLVSDIPEEYQSGDALWIDYTIHMKHQPYSNALIATNVVVHTKIHINEIKNVGDGILTDSYNSPINSFYIKPACINNMLFFGLLHKAPAEQTFEFELLYDSTVQYYPTLYVKARKTNEVTGAETDVKTMSGFDITPFIHQYKNENNELKFFVKYLSEIIDGKEVYSNYTIEMLTIVFDPE